MIRNPRPRPRIKKNLIPTKVDIKFKGKDMSFLYTRETFNELMKELEFADGKTIKVYEYRNFTDFTLIPIIKKMIEKYEVGE